MSTDAAALAATVAFFAGFFLCGLIAGCAGIWKRPANDSYVDSLRESKPAAREPAWYDFLRGYPVVGQLLNRKVWRAFWSALAARFLTGGWALVVMLLSAGYMIRSCQQDQDAHMKTAKAWCARAGCEVLECSNVTALCQVRFPGQSIEWRDCRGSECSKMSRRQKAE